MCTNEMAQMQRDSITPTWQWPPYGYLGVTPIRGWPFAPWGELRKRGVPAHLWTPPGCQWSIMTPRLADHYYYLRTQKYNAEKQT